MSDYDWGSLSDDKPQDKQFKRWHVFTKQGRKIVWDYSAEEAKSYAEKRGLQVIGVAHAPNPLEDFED